jgi:hypothetical protein
MVKRREWLRLLSVLSLTLFLGGCFGRPHEEWAAVRDGTPASSMQTALKTPKDAGAEPGPAAKKDGAPQGQGSDSGDGVVLAGGSQPEGNDGSEGQKKEDQGKLRPIPPPSPPPPGAAKDRWWHLWQDRPPVTAKGKETPTANKVASNTSSAKPTDPTGSDPVGKTTFAAEGLPPARTVFATDPSPANHNGAALARVDPPPGPNGVRTAGATGPEGPLPLPDPHLRTVPTATGALLNLPPGESVAERAVELNGRLAAMEAERRALEARAQQLEAGLVAREQSLQMSGKEMLDAAEEIARTRRELQNWSQELAELRARLRKRDKEDLEAMKSLIPLLERLLESAPPEPKKDPGK